MERQSSRSNSNLHRLSQYAILNTALSKNHSLDLKGQYTSLSNTNVFIDKDLSTLQQSINPSNQYVDTLKYNQAFMQLCLNANYKSYGYNIGIELSNTRDRVYSSINGIKASYSDYSAFGIFHYQYKKGFRIDAGTKFLTNSLTGNYILPQARLTLAPSSILQLRASYNRSISYPSFDRTFYSQEITGITNNLLLNPTLLRTINFNLKITQKKYSLKSGLLYTLQNRSLNEIDEGRTSSGSSTYVTLTYKHNEISITPSFILHGMNHYKDSINQNFFYPELNFQGQSKIPLLNIYTFINLRLLGKYSTVILENNASLLHEIDNSPRLDLSFRKDFLDGKFTSVIGINNVLNNTLVDRNIYRLDEFNRRYLFNNSVVGERERTVFITLKVNLT